MSLFRLDASIRVEGSHSREIADIVEQEWRTAHPACSSSTDVFIDPAVSSPPKLARNPPNSQGRIRP